ncbi:hypothetical protein PgNI_10648 [Pyricularia grisea]|uniref:Uncharacterized protein n=1 Tax=Pyricularia grisea TaxID=148305 RepID=A0A6P8AZ61_PYRGI|nr:hypothetical protein PgNI_10648 [Pyricularia grisea]TLD07627.1 hypothetical protein PgNI_10648 [Pyricularia grisea]
MGKIPRGSHAARQTSQPPALPPIPQQQPRLITSLLIFADSDDEERELEYDGPEIPDELRNILVVPRNPMQPVLTSAKLVLDSWVEREAHLTNEDESTHSFDFSTDEGSDVEPDNAKAVPSPKTPQKSSWSPSQALNVQPFFPTATASTAMEETAMSLPVSSNSECTAWDIPATMPGTSYGIIGANPSQSRDTNPLETSQMDGLSEAAWTQPMDLHKPTTLESSLQNFMQLPFQQISSIDPLDQNICSIADHFAEQNGMGEACGWVPENLTDQNSVATRPTADITYTNPVDHTAAPSFIPQPAFLEQISFGTMSYQPDVMGSFPRPDDQTWAQSQRNQAQEQQQQQLVFPAEAPIDGSKYATNDETSYMSISPSSAPPDSRQDGLPWGNTYAGPTLYSPDLEDVTSTQSQQLWMEHYGSQGDPYKRPSFEQHDTHMQQ